MEKDWQQLLLSLKVTVEGLLANQLANVWNVYGGLNRLFIAVEKLFSHGCIKSSKEGWADYAEFIEGLSWLQPTLFVSLTVDTSLKLPAYVKKSESSHWIYYNLEEHTLSEKLFWLLSDKTHLEACYKEHAFFRQEKYAEAAIICLKAVEQNKGTMLIDVNPALYVINLKQLNSKKHHRRCISLPGAGSCKLVDTIQRVQMTVSDKDLELPVFSSSPEQLTGHVVTGLHAVHGTIPVLPKPRSNSLPDLADEVKTSSRIRSKTISSKLSPSVLRVDYAEVTKKRKEKAAKTRRREEKEVKEWFVVQGKKEKRKKTFMEDGGTSVLPMSTGFFPRPLEGQSLTSFLSSGQFSRANAELDRENAHFSISEAMVAAIEQIKCNKQWRMAEEAKEESDEEINSLKQRIRFRRRQRLEERQRQTRQAWCAGLLSDGRTDTTATDQSVSPCSTSPETPSHSISTDDVDDLELDETGDLNELKDSSLSASMASLYSEGDFSRSKSQDDPSAEAVALSLLKQFKEKQLPRASELEWLVSEQEVPQKLLPLPRSWPVSPDEVETEALHHATPLRGTIDWAPPRPQIIFTIHPTSDRGSLMAKQNLRCAGCGLRVSQEYAHKFRYCEYLGRYFCTGCHSNQLSVIPGRILTNWSFNRYPVSTFSYRLLDQMATDPLFQLNDHNPGLYKKVKTLEKVRRWRLQLYYLKDFVFYCRYAHTLKEELEKEPSYLLTDPDMFSLQDLMQVKSGELPTRLQDLVKQGHSHVYTCELCQAHGFVCELCPSKEVIFPWNIDKVSRCTKCGACYHVACFKSGFCPRCLRADARRQSRADDEF